ncbi:sporulation membrane protein YtaF [Clostridium tarantellae]|uniref:Sporulation membrane protein YtaF n=1 Tax=Clostridium tarantellae TaxID=39493 RepID=A0A6I1MM61_9CLOT|nr:sporulation membrane protein YtaF [Clostridium tarantellae]MPQ44104.1 sporulation membrane protein YtaF [Clostridium tarantellae]
MKIISILLFAIASNLDNFAVAVSYGMKKIKIEIVSNLIISFISALGTFLSMYLGMIILKFINNKITNILGATILILIGIYFIADYFYKRDKETLVKYPEKADKDNSKVIDTKEAILLGIGLNINNLGTGIGACITGLNIYLTTFIVFISSFVFIVLGYILGNKLLSNLFGKISTLISGILIIILGLYELFI